MIRNTAGQYFYCHAFNSSGSVTNDAANIDCNLSIDGATEVSLNASSPIHIGNGFYRFALAQAETNGSTLAFRPFSATTGVFVLGSPSNVIVTNRVSGVGVATAATSEPNDAGSFTIRAASDYDNSTQQIGPFTVESDLDLVAATLRWGATRKIGLTDYAARTDTTSNFIGTVTATAVEGQANTYTLYLNATQAETDKTPGDYGWNAEAVISDTKIRPIIFGELTLLPSFGDHEERD